MALPITTLIQMLSAGLYADANLNNYITDAQARTDSSWYGDNYNKAVALRACHEYTLNQRFNGETGAISSESENGQSISFSQMSSGGVDDLDQTNFGIRLKSLRRAQQPAMGVVKGTATPVLLPDENSDGYFW